jgi:transposase
VTSTPPPPSYEELAALVVELKLLVSAQAATIAEQAERIAELERQVAADSRNSSKPPSSDGLRKKPAPKSLRKASGRKPGRAKGDPGGRLEQVADPDVIVDHRPAACAGCGDDLSGAVSTGYRARQVFDLPEIAP